MIYINKYVIGIYNIYNIYYIYIYI
ncbi:hypothetical protein Avbf_03737 [Armadillidium vulgare]|nr:hypothetical protein Avbf_03737 [Armadillidium vulgare]